MLKINITAHMYSASAQIVLNFLLLLQFSEFFCDF